MVNWVRNPVIAGEATHTHGRHTEAIRVFELSPQEAAPVLKACIGAGGAFTRGYFDVTAESSLQDFERETLHHPVFLVQSVAEIRKEQEAVSGHRTRP